jgi:hypothetical protein
MFSYVTQKCLSNLILRFQIEISPVAFYKTWRTSSRLSNQLHERKPRRRKRVSSKYLHEAYSQNNEATASVLSETLDYVRRLILGTVYEKREVMRREQLLDAGLPPQQLELR